MKKLVSLALALVMILSLSVTVFAASNAPSVLYIDVAGVADSEKTISGVCLWVYVYSGTAITNEQMTHVSGTIYSCDISAVSDPKYNTAKYEIYYTDGSSSLPCLTTEFESGKNLFTATDTDDGTWSVYGESTTPETPVGPSVTNGDKNVTGKYVAGAESGTIYKVDIQWGSMAFTYTAASKGTWSAEKHIYENGAEAKWTWDSGANEIKVTNHSNDGITVTPSYTKDNGYEDASMSFGNAPLTLTTADNGENGAAGTATTGTITVTPGGSIPHGTSGKIGQITLAIASSSSSGGNTPSNDEATITGVKVKVGDTTYGSGETVTLTPDSGSVTIIVTGINLDKGDAEINQVDCNGILLRVASDRIYLNNDGTEGHESVAPSNFSHETDPFEILYTNDGGTNWTGSGVKIVYDANSGSTTTDKAIITGLSITIDGVTYDSSNTSETNPAKITDDSIKNGVTITLTGTNLNNLTEGYVVQMSLGAADTMIDKWDSNSDGTTATKKCTTKTWFSTNTNAFEIRYTNVGSEESKSGVWIIYEK